MIIKSGRSSLNIIAEYSPTRLVIDEEVAELAQKYISEGVFPASKIEDAMRATVATVFEVDALISWNLKHLANLKKVEVWDWKEKVYHYGKDLSSKEYIEKNQRGCSQNSCGKSDYIKISLIKRKTAESSLKTLPTTSDKMAEKTDVQTSKASFPPRTLY